jgi:hypothetical protein
MHRISPQIFRRTPSEPYNQMQMELISNTHIPDGLLASMTLLSEKPRQGVPSRESALHPGIDERNCTALLGLQFRWSGIVSGTVEAPNKGTPPIGTPKTTAQCSIYQDGSATGAGLAFLCSKVFPNGPVSNQIRGCLQSLYNPGSGYVPIPVIIPPGSPGGGTDLNSLLPGTGAHLGCFANAAGLL